MKTYTVAVLVTLGAFTSVLAAPSSAPAGDVEARAEVCRYQSKCSWHWSGLCEDYCGSKGFSHMTSDGCGAFNKKCCCNKD